MILDSGLRATECYLLMHSDDDFRTKSIFVKDTKSGQERYAFFGHKMSTEKTCLVLI
jgi:integrase/recombinase XerD